MTFLSPDLTLGEDDNFKEQSLLEKLTEFSEQINLREVALYDIEELETGQNWFDSADFNNTRNTFRKVILFPSLTAVGTTSVAHELGSIADFTFTKIIGTAKNAAGTLHVALPQGGPDDVMITINANNVNIICATATYNGFSAQIILEYLKN